MMHRMALIGLIVGLAGGGLSLPSCVAGSDSGPDNASADHVADVQAVSESAARRDAPEITGSLSDRTLRVQPLPVDPQFLNPWPPELEAEFWERAHQAIAHYAGQDYGNTMGENEKRSYPAAMLNFLAGHREEAIAFLQREDHQASDHAHTAGIDYYYAFTLKGQIRKYFFFGSWLDPDYQQRMADGGRRWTERDPLHRPHPVYGEGQGQEGWGPDVRGGWVDGRNTDNLRAMREVAVYLMAEEAGNEATRQLYKRRLQRYVGALYHIGMGEWDSENYHDHTMTAYLNLYDFAQDPEVKALAKAALDWLSTAAAVKYYRGGWGGPSKRDYGKGNVVFGSAAARFFWQYFGDAAIANPDPPRDVVHAITSAYRPPLTVVALAQKAFDRPVELLSTKPVYETWKPGNADRPAYWETTFFGHTYQMGSVVSSFADGDVGPFKLMAENSERGVDYVVVNTGGNGVEPGKRPGDQIGQYRNLLIWVSSGDRPFCFQIPQSAALEIEQDIWFVQLEQTWLAIHPIHLNSYQTVAIPDDKLAEHYQNEQTLRADAQPSTSSGSDDRVYKGFALEVGEPQTHGTYREFKRAVIRHSAVDVGAIAQGTVEIRGSSGETLRLTHHSESELPIVIRNGAPHDWLNHLALYQPSSGSVPVTLGWRDGTLRVEAGGSVFESTVSEFEEAP